MRRKITLCIAMCWMFSRSVLYASSLADTPRYTERLDRWFAQGLWEGKLRVHGFLYDWEKSYTFEGKPLRKDHTVLGYGGSLLFKSVYFYGWGVTAGIYTTTGHGSLSRNEAYLYKSGKDTFSRYAYMRNGTHTLTTLAQAYVQYRTRYVDIKVGRQIFESFLTASNDTKMIPNTFLGYSTRITKGDWTLNTGYLTRQKLRDHEEFHHLLAYGYDGVDPLSAWTQNDDAAMHRGLTLAKLQERGIKDRLIVAEFKGWVDDTLSYWLNYTTAPDLLSYAMVQAGYSWHVSGLAVTPAVRYMRQFDDGAGMIGGANLKTLTEGYRDPDSLDGWLLGVRTDFQGEVWRMRFAYTQIGDKGDIVAPWRGFPTGGFTRVMGQYNWYADTRTYMVQCNYDLDKAGIVSGLQAGVRVALQDFDDAKTGVPADSNVYELDLRQTFRAWRGVSMRLRWAHSVGKSDTYSVTGFKKLDPSADEVRVEFKYVF